MEHFEKINSQQAPQTNLDFLAQMTFGLGSILEDIHDLDIDNLPFEVIAEAFNQTLEEEVIPQVDEGKTSFLPFDAPGLIYRVERGRGTFCVRALVSESLEKDFEKLRGLNESSWKSLKMELTEDKKERELKLSELYFFPTDTLAEASILQDNLINRRFPLSEDDLFNISDPGLSWWLDINEDPTCFDIYFKSQGIEREDRFIKLGPIGERKMATKRFNEARDWFFSILPINEYVITDKHFRFKSVDATNPVFMALKDLFVSGEFTFTPDMFSEDNKGKTLYLYFKEISLLRRFWLEIQEILVVH